MFILHPAACTGDFTASEVFRQWWPEQLLVPSTVVGARNIICKQFHFSFFLARAKMKIVLNSVDACHRLSLSHGPSLSVSECPYFSSPSHRIAR